MINETVIKLSDGQLAWSALFIIVAFGIIQFLISTWVKTKIENSIKLESDKKLENYKNSKLQREKAALVAKLFSKWIKYSPHGTSHLSDKDLYDYYEELNRMSLELSLWLKDDKLLSEIMCALNWKKGSKDIRALTGEVRKLILDIENDKFNPQSIVLWNK